MGLRVLVVDDHARFRSIARQVLESAGCEVVGEAIDGRSGMAAASVLRPDLVLLDVMLPDLDGCEVARQIMGAGDAGAVVLVSSREALDYGPRLHDCGARGFLNKASLSREVLDDLIGGPHVG